MGITSFCQSHLHEIGTAAEIPCSENSHPRSWRACIFTHTVKANQLVHSGSGCNAVCESGELVGHLANMGPYN